MKRKLFLFLASLLFSLSSFSQTIAAGADHVISICTNNNLNTWGYNSRGQIGDNTTTDRYVPVQVHGPANVGFLSNIIMVAAGQDHSVALRNDSTVWTWGDNALNGGGMLGDNSTTDRHYPVQVHGPGNLGFLDSIVKITAGDWHTIAIKRDSTVWDWGDNALGQLGDNTTTTRTTPIQVHGVGNVGFLKGIISAAGGDSHTLGVKYDGTVYGWGSNGAGQLGDNSTSNRVTPVQVHGPGNVGFLSNVRMVACGDVLPTCYSAALKNDSTVWCWGDNSNGELGDNTTTQSLTPIQVHGPGNVGFLTGIVSIATGEIHTTALKSDGTVWAWGDNSRGGCGDNSTPDRWTPVQVHGPANVGFLTGITQIATGEYYSVAVRNDGKVWAWGYNLKGQLGDNNPPTDRHYPGQVGSLCTVLMPVEIISLEGKIYGDDDVQIKWSTASETDNNYFAIEKYDENNSVWKEIGIVNGSGNSSTIRNYEFVDITLSDEASFYYRLRQVNYDGSFEYFGPVSVANNSSSKWKLVFSTISSENKLNGTLLVKENANALIDILDLQGRLLKRETLNVKKGSNWISIDLSNVEKGVYFISVYNSKTKVLRKFVKQ